MQKNIHPPYQDVLFEDSSTGARFLIGSTIQTKETTTFEGKEYPLYRVPVSSASHPFYTKATQFMDTEGRLDKFTKKYQRKTAELKETQAKLEEAKKEKTKVSKKK
jgi:large subunit ribosomal protein L31